MINDDYYFNISINFAKVYSLLFCYNLWQSIIYLLFNSYLKKDIYNLQEAQKSL